MSSEVLSHRILWCSRSKAGNPFTRSSINGLHFFFPFLCCLPVTSPNGLFGVHSFESGIAPLESFIEKCHAMVATDLSSPEQHISEPASNVVACVVRHGVRLVKQSFWEAAPVSHSFVHPSTHFALPFHDSGGGKRRFEVIWSAIFRAIHGAPVTPHILREIFQSHAELCALSSAGHRGAAVAQFRSVSNHLIRFLVAAFSRKRFHCSGSRSGSRWRGVEWRRSRNPRSLRRSSRS